MDYVETHDLGHAPPDAIVEETYGKMRSRMRRLYPDDVAVQSTRPDPIFDRADWMQLWQPADPGQERRLYLRHGSGYLTVFANTMRGEARRNGNRIEISASNVASLSLYLNDQMIDFSRPVTVVVNRRTAFDGMLKRGMQRMLNDQLFLGRGWRYYSAALDIDLLPAAATQPASRPATGKGTIHMGSE